MSIGNNIKTLREQKGLTQSEMGKIAGVTDKAVSTWENDIKTPRMGAIQKMADYFGISKSEIIEDVKSKENDLSSDIKYPSMATDIAQREHAVISKYNRLNEDGKEYIEVQIDFALSQNKYIAKEQPHMPNMKNIKKEAEQMKQAVDTLAQLKK